MKVVYLIWVSFSNFLAIVGYLVFTIGCLTLKGDFWTHGSYDLDDSYFKFLMLILILRHETIIWFYSGFKNESRMLENRNLAKLLQFFWMSLGKLWNVISLNFILLVCFLVFLLKIQLYQAKSKFQMCTWSVKVFNLAVWNCCFSKIVTNHRKIKIGYIYGK